MDVGAKGSIRSKLEAPFEGGGLVLFSVVRQALEGDRVLREAGYRVRLVAPPAQLRKGCDLAVEVNLAEKPGIERRLGQAGISYLGLEPLKTGTSTLLEVVTVTDFGSWLMVRAGNMKLTFDKESGQIVNTSGGGCPDIPYLYTELVGRSLNEAPRPRDTGFTLCALMLERALEEGLSIWKGDRCHDAHCRHGSD
jgi:hypothetical protein